VNAPTQVQSTRLSKARDPRSVEISYCDATEYGAFSSDGETIYSVRQVRGGWVCHCLGFSRYRPCCHVAAVPLPRCQHCDATGQPLIAIGQHAEGSPLRCADEAACIARRNPLYAHRLYVAYCRAGGETGVEEHRNGCRSLYRNRRRGPRRERQRAEVGRRGRVAELVEAGHGDAAARA